MAKRGIVGLATGFFLLGIVSMAYAVPVTFFGEDRGLGEQSTVNRLTEYPNATAAQTAFYSNLTGISTEDFEGFGAGDYVADFGGGLTATISGGTLQSGANNVGRFPISGNQYWENSQNFSLIFSEGISAFGFYGVDIGDFNGQVVLDLYDGATLVNSLNIGNTIGIAGGSVLYFGFYDLVNTYTSIVFNNTAAGTDYFGFDDFTIGRLENVTPQPVPEPGTLLLLGSGLAGLALYRRRSMNK